MIPSCHKCKYLHQCDNSQQNHFCEDYVLDESYVPNIEEYDDFFNKKYTESELEEDLETEDFDNDEKEV